MKKLMITLSAIFALGFTKAQTAADSLKSRIDSFISAVESNSEIIKFKSKARNRKTKIVGYALEDKYDYYYFTKLRKNGLRRELLLIEPRSYRSGEYYYYLKVRRVNGFYEYADLYTFKMKESKYSPNDPRNLIPVRSEILIQERQYLKSNFNDRKRASRGSLRFRNSPNSTN